MSDFERLDDAALAGAVGGVEFNKDSIEVGDTFFNVDYYVAKETHPSRDGKYMLLTAVYHNDINGFSLYKDDHREKIFNLMGFEYMGKNFVP